MTRHLAYVAAAIAILLVGCEESGPEGLEPTSPEGEVEEIAGHFTWGWELNDLSPCDIAETWWVEGPESFFVEYGRVASSGEITVFVRVRGEKSERGAWGHLGASDRRFRVTELIEMRPASDQDCED
jgi:hypothetical protein